jgi:hypothetical protein
MSGATLDVHIFTQYRQMLAKLCIDEIMSRLDLSRYSKLDIASACLLISMHSDVDFHTIDNETFDRYVLVATKGHGMNIIKY